MPNPHRRCKVCKERHAPGNCQEFGDAVRARISGDFDWMGLARVVGELFTSSLDLVDYIENGVKGEHGLRFTEGTVGGVRLERLKAVLKKAGTG